MVYVGSDDHNVYCLNAMSGAFVWKYKTGNVVFSSPAVAGGLVYVGSYDGNVYCLNATTGTLVWSYTTGGSVGYSSSAVVNGVVYVASYDGKVYAFGPSPFPVSISPTSVTMDVGKSNLFTSTVSGGTSPYSYQWYLNGTPVSGGIGSTWTFTPTSKGSYTVHVKVTDSVGAQATSNTAAVTASPQPLSPNWYLILVVAVAAAIVVGLAVSKILKRPKKPLEPELLRIARAEKLLF